MNSMVASAHHQSVNAHALQNLMRVLTKRRKWIIGSIVICELLAILLTFTLNPLVFALQKLHFNRVAAVVTVMLLTALAIAGVCLAVARQVEGLATELPEHKDEIIRKIISTEKSKL